MKYFGFLARYVVLPLLLLRFLIWRDQQASRELPDSLQSWDENQVLIAHAVTAVTYTTIWDNYLVASGVWSYDPDLVTGIRIGWVPIEEYSFFVLQPLLTGSWLQYIARRYPVDTSAYSANRAPQMAVVGALGVVWAASVYTLFKGSPRAKYLSLILGWALPPIMFQIGFGGDILWRNRGLIATSLIPSTLYLGVADSHAIESGTWAINPENTVGLDVLPNLPFEEFLFFLLTNTLLVFGVTLVQSKESENRLPQSLRKAYFEFKAKRNRKGS
ncbi:MAG: lycopene cyclase domain-containing protein [Anaerolineae bacterium]|jgi:lycopene cyclase domain-containing protein|nr:lycopene cyclase domain-containing protein [Anaerolineae bacterium]